MHIKIFWPNQAEHVTTLWLMKWSLDLYRSKLQAKRQEPGEWFTVFFLSLLFSYCLLCHVVCFRYFSCWYQMYFFTLFFSSIFIFQLTCFLVLRFHFHQYSSVYFASIILAGEWEYFSTGIIFFLYMLVQYFNNNNIPSNSGVLIQFENYNSHKTGRK